MLIYSDPQYEMLIVYNHATYNRHFDFSTFPTTKELSPNYKNYDLKSLERRAKKEPRSEEEPTAMKERRAKENIKLRKSLGLRKIYEIALS